MKMRKLKYIKFMTLLLSMSLLNAKVTYAFTSPATLTLIALSIGPWIKYLLVVIITVIVTFSINIKKQRKKIIFALIICLVVLISLSAVKFTELKQLNTRNRSIFVDEILNLKYARQDKSDHALRANDKLSVDALEGLSADKVEEINCTTIELDEFFQNERSIRLDSIDEVSYSKFKKIQLTGPFSKYPLADAEYIDFNTLWDILIYQKGTIKKYLLRGLDIKKNDTLLFVCTAGWGSQIIAYFLWKEGYDAYYGSLNAIDNRYLIDNLHLRQDKDKNIVTDSLDYDPTKEYILFLFDIEENYFVSYFPDLISENRLKENIFGVEVGISSEKHTKKIPKPGEQ